MQETGVNAPVLQLGQHRPIHRIYGFLPDQIHLPRGTGNPNPQLQVRQLCQIAAVARLGQNLQQGPLRTQPCIFTTPLSARDNMLAHSLHAPPLSRLVYPCCGLLCLIGSFKSDAKITPKCLTKRWLVGWLVGAQKIGPFEGLGADLTASAALLQWGRRSHSGRSGYSPTPPTAH